MRQPSLNSKQLRALKKAMTSPYGTVRNFAIYFGVPESVVRYHLHVIELRRLRKAAA